MILWRVIRDNLHIVLLLIGNKLVCESEQEEYSEILNKIEGLQTGVSTGI